MSFFAEKRGGRLCGGDEFSRFFYCNIQGRSKGFQGFVSGTSREFAELGSYILGLYGVSNWFADLDQSRCYWKESEGIIAYLLDYLSNEAFHEFIKENGGKWLDAQHYRQRHLIRAIEKKSIF